MVLQEAPSIPAFVAANHGTFTTRKGGQPPKCVEPVTYCYNTLPLAGLLENDFSRFAGLFENDFAMFALLERSGDNIHNF